MVFIQRLFPYTMLRVGWDKFITWLRGMQQGLREEIVTDDPWDTDTLFPESQPFDAADSSQLSQSSQALMEPPAQDLSIQDRSTQDRSTTSQSDNQ